VANEKILYRRLKLTGRPRTHEYDSTENSRYGSYTANVILGFLKREF